jgi:acetyl-CoA carboxylase biotin carboxyl carrier protein
MDLERIESLLALLEKHDVSEFAYRDENLRMKLRLGQPPAPVILGAGHPVAPASPPANPHPAAAHATPTAAQQADSNVRLIESPMVGTFYRSPKPGAPSFVEVGTKVQKGQTVCIVEAMKLMNEIEAEVSGTVEAILVENGTPVQFGQDLIRIRVG